MKGVIRLVLVDPRDDTRQRLCELISSIGTLWLAEMCSSYQTALKVVDDNTPDLTLIVVDQDPDQAAGLVREILKGNPEAVVLPAGRSRDGDLILGLIRAGAREYLPLPVDVDELLEAIERMTRGTAANADEDGSPHVVAVTGAAGGIGTTALAVNLAAELAKQPERSSVLIDFDLLLGSIDTCLDIIPDHTLLEVVQNIDRLDLPLLKRSIIRHASGLYVLPHPVALEDAAKIDPDALRQMLVRFKATFDTVIVDTSKGLQSTDFVAFELADIILLVVQLDLNCLRNSVRLMQLFRQIDDMGDRVRVIVNRAGASASEISLRKAEETLNCKITYQIPDMPKQFDAARSRGVPLEEEAPGCRAHRVIADLAAELAGQFEVEDDPQRGRRGGLLGAFR